MSQLNKDTIKNLTLLSRIHCTEDEQEALLKDLDKILTYFEELKAIDTTNVAPCNHVLEGMHNVMREDVIGESMPRELFLQNVPSHVGGYVRVPPVKK